MIFKGVGLSERNRVCLIVKETTIFLLREEVNGVNRVTRDDSSYENHLLQVIRFNHVDSNNMYGRKF